MIKGLSHITFICKDLDKSSNMLKLVFNAQEIYSSDEKNFSLSKEKFFDVAGLWIVIMEGESVEKTYNHVAFQVNAEDLPSFEEKIRAAGLEAKSDRNRFIEEGKSLYFYDYDNHLFELHSGDLATRISFYKKLKS